MSKSCCTLEDFGVSNCNPEWGAIIGAIFLNRKNSIGNPTIFSIKDGLTYELLQAGFFGDTLDRFHPMPLFKNVVPTKAESKTVESSNGSLAKLYSGKRSFTVELWEGDGTPTLQGKIEAMECGKTNVILLTANGFMIGAKSALLNTFPAFDPLFGGIPIDEKSVNAMFNFQTDDAPRKIMFSFDLERNFKDKDLYAIDCNKLWSTTASVYASMDLTDLPVTLGVNLSFTNATTTSVDVTVNDDFRQGAITSGQNEAGNVTGLTISDFALKNITTVQNEIIISAIEIAYGVYTMTFAAQTIGEIMEVSLLNNALVTLNYSGSGTYTI